MVQGAVTALGYSKDGALLASGSQDTDVVVWDVAGETGLFRLRGHLDQVTDLVSNIGLKLAQNSTLSACESTADLVSNTGLRLAKTVHSLHAGEQWRAERRDGA